jgi:catechol 2,3-dioxygenase-like lactoylglutathione lyase family enzyme
MANDDTVSVRYMVDDVDDALAFYTKVLGFEILTHPGPPFADVKRGNLRLLLSGPGSSAGQPMPDGTKPEPGGWNRIHFIVDDLGAEVVRLTDAGARFRKRHRRRTRGQAASSAVDGAAAHRGQECRVTWNRTRRSFWVPKPAVGRMNSPTLIVCTPVSWLHLS